MAAVKQIRPLARSVVTRQYLEIIRLRAGREQAWQAAEQDRKEASEMQRKRDEQLREDTSREQKKNERRHAEHLHQMSLMESELRALKRDRGEWIRKEGAAQAEVHSSREKLSSYKVLLEESQVTKPTSVIAM